MYGPALKTQQEKDTWARIDKLGLTKKVIDYIDDITKQVIEQGYEVYPSDYIEEAIKQGLQKGGIKQDTEFNAGEVIALSYLFGVLLAHGILKYEAKSLIQNGA